MPRNHDINDVIRELAALREHLDARFNRNHERQNAMDATLQRAIDDIAKNKSIADSVVAGIGVIEAQVTDLQAQVAALQAQIAGGGTISSGDLATLGTSLNDLEASTTELGTAIPANTTPGPGAKLPPATPVQLSNIKAALGAAIASGNDPSKLQALHDSIDVPATPSAGL